MTFVKIDGMRSEQMNIDQSRRDCIRHAALLSLAVACTPWSNASAAFAPIQRAGAGRLMPGLNAYSFLDMLSANAKDANQGIDLFGVCDFAAKLKFDAIDLTGYFFPGYPDAPADDFIQRIKRHTHDLGLAISGTGVRNDFTAADRTVRAKGVQIIKNWVEVAAKLGAPAVRVFADAQPPFKNWLDASGNASRDAVETWMADALRECAEHAKKAGVMIAVQNHGDFISTGAQHLSLLKRVDHECCAALVDTGKYMTPDPYADIAMMVPYAVNWQIKETTQSSTKSPRTDFKKLVAVIRDGGYRGYLPIETLAMGRKDYDPRVEIAKVLAELREAITASEAKQP
jgi:sugar phosphate isomerase/epimerase